MRNRLNARRNLLNKRDMAVFSQVPAYIVDSFYGKCTYKNRMQVVAFALINGISPYCLIRLVRWNDTSAQDIYKIKKLFDYMMLPKQRDRYYSFDTRYNRLTYMSGNPYTSTNENIWTPNLYLHNKLTIIFIDFK